MKFKAVLTLEYGSLNMRVMITLIIMSKFLFLGLNQKKVVSDLNVCKSVEWKGSFWQCSKYPSSTCLEDNTHLAAQRYGISLQVFSSISQD